MTSQPKGVQERDYRSPVLLLLSWLALAFPWLSGQFHIPFDSEQYFFPALWFAVDQLKQGQLPWWNPYLFGGYPQAADPQAMTFQPSMIMSGLLLGLDSIRSFDFIVLLHVLACGFGAKKLAEAWGFKGTPTVIFALIFMFGSVAASRLQHTPIVVSWSIAPWVWWALFNLKREPSPRWVVGSGLLLGLLALQLVQLTVLVALSCAFLALWTLCEKGGDQKARKAIAFGAAALIGISVSAPQWLSTLAWLPFTNRSALELSDSLIGSIHPMSLSTLVSGNALQQGAGNYWGRGDLSQDYFYFGAVPLACWIAWGGDVRAAHPIRSLLALTVVILCSIMALGLHTPIYELLFNYMPGAKLFRRPADFLYLAIPAAAWLTAASLAMAMRGKGMRPHLPSLVVCISLLSWGLWNANQHEALAPTIKSAALSILIGGLAVFALVRIKNDKAQTVGLLVVLLMVLDYGIFNSGRTFNSMSYASHSLQSPIHAQSSAARQWLLTSHAEPDSSNNPPQRTAVYGVYGLLNGALVSGTYLTNGYNPMRSGIYSRSLGVGDYPPFQPETDPPLGQSPGAVSVTRQLLGQSRVVSTLPFDGSQQFAAHVFVLDGLPVLPRTLSPVEIRFHAQELPSPMEFEKTDFSQTLWLPEGTHTGYCSGNNDAPVEVTAINYRAQQIEVSVTAKTAGWLVLNEVFSPGWIASADGEDMPIVRANGIFRAVCIPANTNQVLFIFRLRQLWKVALHREKQ